MTDNPLIDTNPQLLKVRDEIEAILDREQIAGAFQISNSTHTEFRLRFPSWCAIQPEQGDANGTAFRVKAKASEDRERLEASVHMLLSMRDCVTMQAVYLNKLADAISKALADAGVEVEHKPFGGEV